MSNINVTKYIYVSAGCVGRSLTFTVRTHPLTPTPTPTHMYDIHTPAHSAITIDKIRLAYFEARTDALALRVTLSDVAVINLIIIVERFVTCACA